MCFYYSVLKYSLHPLGPCYINMMFHYKQIHVTTILQMINKMHIIKYILILI